MYNLVNVNLLCGGSFVVDNDNKLVKVDSDLVQYEYRQYQNAFTEISRKKGIHSNIIRIIIEIINHKEMKELVTVSLDGNVIIWN